MVQTEGQSAMTFHYQQNSLAVLEKVHNFFTKTSNCAINTAIHDIADKENNNHRKWSTKKYK